MCFTQLCGYSRDHQIRNRTLLCPRFPSHLQCFTATSHFTLHSHKFSYSASSVVLLRSNRNHHCYSSATNFTMNKFSMPKPFSPDAFTTGDCPFFGELGKQSKDLFQKGFYLGVVNLKMNANVDRRLEVISGHEIKLEDGKVTSHIEPKFHFRNIDFKQNITLEPKWGGELKVKGLLYDWATVKMHGEYDTAKRDCKGRVSLIGQFKDMSLEWVAHSDKTMADIGAKANLVAKVYGNCYIGTSLETDAKDKSVKGKLTCGYETDKYSVFMDYDQKDHQLGGTVFHSLWDNLKLGIVFAKQGDQDVAGIKAASVFGKDCKEEAVAICADYNLKNGASLKVRVNNKWSVGAACTLDLKGGFQTTLCCELNAKEAGKEGIQKIGLGIEF